MDYIANLSTALGSTKLTGFEKVLTYPYVYRAIFTDHVLELGRIGNLRSFARFAKIWDDYEDEPLDPALKNGWHTYYGMILKSCKEVSASAA